MRKLTSTEMGRYRQDGYIQIDDVFPLAELTAIDQIAAALESGALDANPPAPPAEPVPGRRGGRGGRNNGASAAAMPSIRWGVSRSRSVWAGVKP